MKVEVSVIIPVYNKEKYLEACLKSVRGQSLKNLEIICVDDGSTDTSLRILENLQKEDKRIVILRQKNMGPGIARNRGLERAKGEFVHFLDADDYYMNESSLEELYQAGMEQNVEAVSGLFFVDNGRDIVQDNIFGSLTDDVGKGKRISYQNYQYDFYQYDFIFRREFLLKYGIKFPERFIYEDPPFFVRAMAEAKEFYIQPVPFYCYRWSRQKRVYCAEQIIDLLSGLKENLCLSADYRLKKLHRLTYYRINEWYLSDIMSCMKQENYKVLQLLMDLNSSVNWNWITEKESLDVPLIKPLALMVKCIEKEISFKGFAEKMYAFPFHKTHKGAKIALYGAGQVGKEYYRQLLSSDGYKLVLWLDKDAENISNGLFKVENLKNLFDVQWDYIVIAIANMEIALLVWEDLLNRGVSKEKIVWSIAYNDIL